MPVKTYKPTSPGRRGMSVSTFEEITKTKPERALTEPLRKTAGRNNNGRITTRHRGGGHKRLYRVIDWKRDKVGIAGRVIAIEYDPNRSARIALIQYADLERRYILAPVVPEPVATSLCASALGCRLAPRQTWRRATRSPCGTSRWARSSTTSS